jgi:hypothetical protein
MLCQQRRGRNAQQKGARIRESLLRKAPHGRGLVKESEEYSSDHENPARSHRLTPLPEVPVHCYLRTYSLASTAFTILL